MKRFKRLLYLIGAGIGILIVGCAVLLAYLWFQHSQTVVLPAPTGPYHVGRIITDWVDASRKETLANTNGARAN